jgi:hypothetical protein
MHENKNGLDKLVSGYVKPLLFATGALVAGYSALDAKPAILQWKNNATNATGNVIKQSSDGIVYTTLGSTGPLETSYALNLLEGTTTYLRVQAVNGFGESTGADKQTLAVTVSAAGAMYTQTNPTLAPAQWEKGGVTTNLIPVADRVYLETSGAGEAKVSFPFRSVQGAQNLLVAISGYNSSGGATALDVRCTDEAGRVGQYMSLTSNLVPLTGKFVKFVDLAQRPYAQTSGFDKTKIATMEISLDTASKLVNPPAIGPTFALSQVHIYDAKPIILTKFTNTDSVNPWQDFDPEPGYAPMPTGNVWNVRGISPTLKYALATVGQPPSDAKDVVAFIYQTNTQVGRLATSGAAYSFRFGSNVNTLSKLGVQVLLANQELMGCEMPLVMPLSAASNTIEARANLASFLPRTSVEQAKIVLALRR